MVETLSWQELQPGAAGPEECIRTFLKRHSKVRPRLQLLPRPRAGIYRQLGATQ